MAETKRLSPKTVIKRWMVAKGHRKDYGDFIYVDPIVGGASLSTHSLGDAEAEEWIKALTASGYDAKTVVTRDGRLRVHARVPGA